jgi:hypothetical protein
MPESFLPRVQAAIEKRIRVASKRVYQTARWRNLEQPRVLFIVGCQRSGTTLMVRLFDADINCRVFGEFSELSSADKQAGIRLNPLPDVAAVINRVPAPLVVAKPLVETQNVRTLLNYFPGSRALFMYRRWADVARSDLAEFGVRNGISNIRPIAEGNHHNWRSAGASRTVREIVRRYYSEDMNPNDAAALFWFARNQLFFDLELASCANVMLCKYEHLTREPAVLMRRIYDFVAVPVPDLSHTAQVHSSSVRKGSEAGFSTPVQALCDQLERRLDDHYEQIANDSTAQSAVSA